MAPGRASWAVAVVVLVLARQADALARALPRKDSQPAQRQEAFALVAVMVRSSCVRWRLPLHTRASLLRPCPCVTPGDTPLRADRV